LPFYAIASPAIKRIQISFTEQVIAPADSSQKIGYV